MQPAAHGYAADYIEWKRYNFVCMREQEAITKHIHLLFIYTL